MERGQVGLWGPGRSASRNHTHESGVIVLGAGQSSKRLFCGAKCPCFEETESESTLLLLHQLYKGNTMPFKLSSQKLNYSKVSLTQLRKYVPSEAKQ